LERSRKQGNQGEEELGRYCRLGEILLHNCSSMIPSGSLLPLLNWGAACDSLKPFWAEYILVLLPGPSTASRVGCWVQHLNSWWDYDNDIPLVLNTCLPPSRCCREVLLECFTVLPCRQILRQLRLAYQHLGNLSRATGHQLRAKNLQVHRTTLNQ
jgi:hypothetical protein